MKDIKLIDLILNDPEAGISQAINMYGGVVKSVCNRVLRGYKKEDIEEAWSDTFVKLWKYAGKFDPNRNASLKTYIITIARSVSLDICRKCGTGNCEELMEDNMVDISINIEEDFARRQNEEILHQVVNCMEEPDKTIFILRFFYFFSVKEIAQKMDLKPKKVENILFRRKGRLKEALIEGGVLND